MFLILKNSLPFKFSSIISLFSDSKSALCHGACNKPQQCVDGVDFSPDPTDCHRYYQCYKGEWTPLTCTQGGVYDNVTCTCQSNTTANCLIQTCQETTTAVLTTDNPTTRLSSSAGSL